MTIDILLFIFDFQGEAQKADQSHYHHRHHDTTTVYEINSGMLQGKGMGMFEHFASMIDPFLPLLFYFFFLFWQMLKGLVHPVIILLSEAKSKLPSQAISSSRQSSGSQKVGYNKPPLYVF